MVRLLCIAVCIMTSLSIYAQEDFESLKQKMTQQFNNIKQKNEKDFEDFRAKANEQYALVLKQAWKQFNAYKGKTVPEEKPVPVVIYNKQQDKEQRKDENKQIKQVIIPDTKPVVQPQPLEPIKEDKTVKPSSALTTVFYGTNIKTDMYDNYKFRLNSTKENDISSAWKTLSLPKYDRLISQCLKIRKDYRLNDWAYLQMLDEFSSNIMGKKCNEATLLTAYIYCQSGYNMRLGENKNKLYLLYASEGTVFGKDYYIVDAQTYYLYNAKSLESLKICKASFPKEKAMSLQMHQQPLLANNTSSYRTLQSKRYPEIKIKTSVNKNLIDFYNNYPNSMIKGDFGTRWAIYANTPLSDEAKKTLYPELKKVLQNKTTKESAEMLLNFVQTSLVYEYDDKVWGEDRAFFAEETLFYPYADCEDRAILFSRLVRDLLGIKAVLIYYPGHLATAICLNSADIKGDYVLIDGKKYYIADPTYIGAPIGLQMPDLKNEEIKVITLSD